MHRKRDKVIVRLRLENSRWNCGLEIWKIDYEFANLDFKIRRIWRNAPIFL